MGYEEGEVELEEGQAAFGGGAGCGTGGAVAVVDPDTLTYIDEKLQYLLGYFQKKFEGEISAENLGSQYGGYGSFLPTYSHSPLVLPQSRSPVVPPHHGSASRSPCVPMETTEKNHFVKTALDIRRRNDHYQISNERDGNPAQQLLNGGVNGLEKKTPKLRIKVNGHGILARNTSDIYSGLGLDISPSSSVEGSLDGSAGDLMPDVLRNESPHTIFKIMTCYTVPGGLLLSPLEENALQLREKTKFVMEKHEAPEVLDDVKAELHRKQTCTTSATLNNRDHMAKEKSDEKEDGISDFKCSKRRLQNPQAVDKVIKSELPDISDDTDSIVLPKTIETVHLVQSSAFTSEILDQLKERKNDALKGHIVDKNQKNKKEPLLGHVFSSKAKCDSDEGSNRSLTSLSHLPDISNETMSLERDEKIVYVKAEQCQNKSKEMGSLSNAESVDIVTENVDQNSSGVTKVNKKITLSQDALPRRKIRVKAHKQLNDDTTRKLIGEDENRAFNHRIDLANVYPKKIDTIVSEETDNKSCHLNGVDHKINSLFIDTSDPLPSACTNENAESSTALMAPEPVVINEEWVCCDKCEKWRLLPYGMNPDILPQKWRCNLLNWLPGMNSCKISEDDTTRALRALYMVPASENSILDGHHDNGASGIDRTTNIQSTNTPGKLKGCHDGANLAINLDWNDMSKPSKKLHAHSSRNSDGVDCFPKHREKRKNIESSRKGENIAKDRTPPTRTNIGVRVGQDNLRASKKMKKECNEPAVHHSSEFVISKNSASVNETPKNMHKHTGNSPGMGKYGSSSSGKHHHGEDKYFSDEVVKTSGAGKSGVPDLSTMKKKSRQRLLSQHDPDSPPSNNIAKCITKQSETNVVKEKSRPQLKFSKADRTVVHGKGGVTEVDDFEKPQGNIHFKLLLPSESSTKRNACHTQMAAATSSSSKVSNSHKDKTGFKEARASPVESVCSSPLRTSDKNSLDQHKRRSCAITENVHSQESGKNGLARSKRKFDFGSDSDQAKARLSGVFNGDMDCHVVKDENLLIDDQDLKNTGLNKKDSLLDAKNGQLNPVKEKKVNGQLNPVKEQKVNTVTLSQHDNHSHKQLASHENGKTPPHFSSNQSDHTNMISWKVKPDKGNIQHKDLKISPSLVGLSKQHQSLNNAGSGNATCKVKQSEKAVIENLETKQETLTQGASNPINASVLLKEAQDLKHLSDRLKGKGDDFESTSMCFEAALKFLHVGSLWEASSDSSKQVDPTLVMKLFSDTGNLCGFCAQEFERLKKMANAALAYKCVEVAYMKAAFIKHPGAVKDRHALQTVSLMAPPAESPSSSASDVDNLNNQSTAAKTISVRGVYSPQIASNPISRNNHHMMGLLAYAENVNNAFEGTKKSQNSFSAYLSGIGKNQVDGVALVRKILDFSFHNVKGLLQLIRQSLESINHESIK